MADAEKQNGTEVLEKQTDSKIINNDLNVKNKNQDIVIPQKNINKADDKQIEQITTEEVEKNIGKNEVNQKNIENVQENQVILEDTTEKHKTVENNEETEENTETAIENTAINEKEEVEKDKKLRDINEQNDEIEKKTENKESEKTTNNDKNKQEKTKSDKIEENKINVDEKVEDMSEKNKTINKKTENSKKPEQNVQDNKKALCSDIAESEENAETKEENINIEKKNECNKNMKNLTESVDKMDVEEIACKNDLENIDKKKKDTENTEVKILEEDSLDNKLGVCRELYSKGSRNYLLKNYQEAADELGEACELFEEIYGPESSELGMPLLLYAKSLIALSLDENKILDVPDVEEEEDSEDQTDGDEAEAEPSDSTEVNTIKKTPKLNDDNCEKENQVSSSSNGEKEQPSTSNEIQNCSTSASSCLPKTNGEAENENKEEEEEDGDATNLQIAWETLELAAKIYSKQGMSGLPNLAEIHTELGNIQFENEIFDAAREDYGKALRIYEELPVNEHRRAQAEIHYKIGLTFLLQTMNKEGCEAFKTACDFLSDEIEEIKNKGELKDSDKTTIKDIEETQQDIMAKIAEIEETRQQVLDEVRAALDKYKSPTKQSSENTDNASSPIGSSASSSKPTDISHLIKRKKPDTISEEAEHSPAKRLNTEKTE